MGIRNLTAVMFDGEYRIAQYYDYDGVPSGQGILALNFCKKLQNISVLQKFLYQLTKIDFRLSYCSLGQEESSRILDYVLNCKNKEILLKNSIDFANNSLFCEWAYVLDLDKSVLEVFRGFNLNILEHHERFARGVHLSYRTFDGKIYYPVKLLHRWKLDQLPSKRKFVEILDSKVCIKNHG